jgi:DNA-binding HxlR family transcriptional regulator
MSQKLASKFICPTEFALDVLGGKWKTVVLCYLSYGPRRYSELHALIPRLSDKVLTERLRELIAKDLVYKQAGRAPGPAAGYALTAKGRTLGKVLASLYDWGKQNAAAFGVEVDEPLRRLGLRR